MEIGRIFMKKLFLLGMTSIFMVSCLHVTVREDNQEKISLQEPSYEDSKNFFFWGLLPDHREVNLKNLCKGGEFDQLQAMTTGMNGFLTAITLGIYSPRTTKVWCKKEGSSL